jgi:dihydrofolate reductase
MFAANLFSMRKIILSVAVSLDGFIEGPGGEYDWCFTDQDYGMTAFMNSIDAILYGRKSYEVMKQMEPGANPFLNIKGYVFSNTLTNVDPGFEILSGDIVPAVKEMKTAKGKNIWLFGGASLTASLMNAGLVDEIGLAIHPILLGAGKPLFSGLRDRTKLLLLETKEYNSGLVSVLYQVGQGQ